MKTSIPALARKKFTQFGEIHYLFRTKESAVDEHPFLESELATGALELVPLRL